MVFYCKMKFLASKKSFQDTFQNCIIRLKRSKIKAIWYVSNKQNQTPKSPFDPKQGLSYMEYWLRPWQ